MTLFEADPDPGYVGMRSAWEGGTASFSEDGTYRWDLTRRWGTRGALHLWVMLNPSTATDGRDDHTIRRCCQLSRRDNATGIVVVNLFALRATNPAQLLTHPDPRGPENANVIRRWLDHPDVVQVNVAWGGWLTHQNERRRPTPVDVAVLAIEFNRTMWCIGRTADGDPKHPSRSRRDARFERWAPEGRGA